MAKLSKTYIDAMEVGNMFGRAYYNDKRTEEWCGSEECSAFAEVVIGLAQKFNISLKDAFLEYGDKIIDFIESDDYEPVDHFADALYRGFVAGEVFGYPTEANLKLVSRAEYRWEKDRQYGFFQDVCNELLNEEAECCD